MSRDYLNPDAPIEKHRGPLPHWEQNEVIQFVTFRLGDSLPRDKILEWKTQSQVWRVTWPPPWTPEVEAEYHRRFSGQIGTLARPGLGLMLAEGGGNERNSRGNFHVFPR
jgi:hypothetical protein